MKSFIPNNAGFKKTTIYAPNRVAEVASVIFTSLGVASTLRRAVFTAKKKNIVRS